jgi:C-terminal processing protease CtpA/Prc
LPESPAEQAQIDVGSVIKMVDGQDISDLDEEEMRDLTRHFEGAGNTFPTFRMLLPILITSLAFYL